MINSGFPGSVVPGLYGFWSIITYYRRKMRFRAGIFWGFLLLAFFAFSHGFDCAKSEVGEKEFPATAFFHLLTDGAIPPAHCEADSSRFFPGTGSLRSHTPRLFSIALHTRENSNRFGSRFYFRTALSANYSSVLSEPLFIWNRSFLI